MNMRKTLTAHELEFQVVEVLPTRTEMSLVNANLALPVNAAIAANVLSDNAVAGAVATQSSYIPQGI
ncbi:MAG: hypothetical protein E6I70_14550 [Chloroflexi bacterium]|nr:MAG: hypothetical protein E6I70_14550 [Chloroflexota bacterium]